MNGGARAGCFSKDSTERKYEKRTLPLNVADADPARVADELNKLLANDILARMEAVGTLPHPDHETVPRNVLVVYNPHSGKNKAGKV